VPQARCYRRPTVEEAATIGTARTGAPAADVSVRLDFAQRLTSGAEGRSAAEEPVALAAAATGSQPV
jgi:hypothetical protein